MGFKTNIGVKCLMSLYRALSTVASVTQLCFFKKSFESYFDFIFERPGSPFSLPKQYYKYVPSPLPAKCVIGPQPVNFIIQLYLNQLTQSYYHIAHKHARISRGQAGRHRSSRPATRQWRHTVRC